VDFRIDSLTIEDQCRHTALATRVLKHLGDKVPVRYVADGREAARLGEGQRPFETGKSQLTIMQRRQPFLMACPAGSAEFACCGYLVMTLASNCPMDCSYCFLQEFLADNPALQIYANYADGLDEVERLRAKAPTRRLRIGTGELADSLAFDSITEISSDLIGYFARQTTLTLELKTKTDEIANLIELDPKGRTLVSWTLSPPAVFRACEHGTAPPHLRLGAARRVLDCGYQVAFHFDPLIDYQGAERDYLELIDELFDTIDPKRISFISIGGLRMSPRLSSIARRRFPEDRMLAGSETVLAPDGRLRTFTPRRLRLYRAVSNAIKRSAPELASYLCMETASVSRQVFGFEAPSPAVLAERLALR
jgi:spore photoproduct lyase